MPKKKDIGTEASIRKKVSFSDNIVEIHSDPALLEPDDIQVKTIDEDYLASSLSSLRNASVAMKIDLYSTFLTQFRTAENIDENAFAVSSSPAVNIIEILSKDLFVDDNDLVQSALRFLGFILYESKIVGQLEEETISNLVSLVLRVIKNSKNKITCQLALWCLSVQRIPRSIVDKLALTVIQMILSSFNIHKRSTSLQAEALGALEVILKQSSEECTFSTVQLWFKVVLEYLMVPFINVRVKALAVLKCVMPRLITAPSRIEKLSLEFHNQHLKGCLEKLLSFSSNNEDEFVLEAWGYLLIFLGKKATRSSYLPMFLQIIEGAFNKSKISTKKKAMEMWSFLAYSFSLNNIANLKRIGLLMVPIGIWTKYPEDLRLATIKTWLFILYNVGSDLPGCFNIVVPPILLSLLSDPFEVLSDSGSLVLEQLLTTEEPQHKRDIWIEEDIVKEDLPSLDDKTITKHLSFFFNCLEKKILMETTKAPKYKSDWIQNKSNECLIKISTRSNLEHLLSLAVIVLGITNGNVVPVQPELVGAILGMIHQLLHMSNDISEDVYIRRLYTFTPIFNTVHNTLIPCLFNYHRHPIDLSTVFLTLRDIYGTFPQDHFCTNVFVKIISDYVHAVLSSCHSKHDHPLWVEVVEAINLFSKNTDNSLDQIFTFLCYLEIDVDDANFSSMLLYIWNSISTIIISHMESQSNPITPQLYCHPLFFASLLLPFQIVSHSENPFFESTGWKHLYVTFIKSKLFPILPRDNLYLFRNLIAIKPRVVSEKFYSQVISCVCLIINEGFNWEMKPLNKDEQKELIESMASLFEILRPLDSQKIEFPSFLALWFSLATQILEYIEPSVISSFLQLSLPCIQKWIEPIGKDYKAKSYFARLSKKYEHLIPFLHLILRRLTTEIPFNQSSLNELLPLFTSILVIRNRPLREKIAPVWNAAVESSKEPLTCDTNFIKIARSIRKKVILTIPGYSKNNPKIKSESEKENESVKLKHSTPTKGHLTLEGLASLKKRKHSESSDESTPTAKRIKEVENLSEKVKVDDSIVAKDEVESFTGERKMLKIDNILCSNQELKTQEPISIDSTDSPGFKVASKEDDIVEFSHTLTQLKTQSMSLFKNVTSIRPLLDIQQLAISIQQAALGQISKLFSDNPNT